MNRLFIFILVLFTGCHYPPYIGETEREYKTKSKYATELYVRNDDSTVYWKFKTSDSLHYYSTYYIFKEGVCTEIINQNEVRDVWF
jgi:hypothetical protein